MTKPGIYSTSKEWRAYWNNWLRKTEMEMSQEDEIDTMTKSLVEVIKVAVDCDQFEKSENELSDVVRLCKVNIKLDRQNIEHLFGVKTYSIYGVGLFIPVEGILLTGRTRDLIGYDDFLERGSRIRTDMFSQETIDSYEFRLMTPAFDGLFVPKKTRMTAWIGRSWALSYLDITKIA